MLRRLALVLLATGARCAPPSGVDVSQVLDGGDAGGSAEVADVEDLPAEARTRDDDNPSDSDDLPKPTDIGGEPESATTNDSEPPFALCPANQEVVDDECGNPCGEALCGCPEGEVCITATQTCEPEMVYVPGGPFMMGCNPEYEGPTRVSTCAAEPVPGETGWQYHEVEVREFWIDRVEVSADAYKACVSAKGCRMPGTTLEDDFQLRQSQWWLPGFGNRPAHLTAWADAADYCSWKGKRLCTEAEWEKAAHGTDGRLLPWGQARWNCLQMVMIGGHPACHLLDVDALLEYGVSCPPACGLASYDGEVVLDVGSRPLGVSPYGAVDMSGNALNEAVEDTCHVNYLGAPGDGSAWIDGGTILRMVRDLGPFVESGSYAFGRACKQETDLNQYSGIRCCRSEPGVRQERGRIRSAGALRSTSLGGR